MVHFAAEPRTLAIKLTGMGKNLRFSVPESVPGGVVPGKYVLL